MTYLVLILRVGQNHIYIRLIYAYLAGKSPNIRSYTVYIYGSGQPYLFSYCVRQDKPTTRFPSHPHSHPVFILPLPFPPHTSIPHPHTPTTNTTHIQIRPTCCTSCLRALRSGVSGTHPSGHTAAADRVPNTPPSSPSSAEQRTGSRTCKRGVVCKHEYSNDQAVVQTRVCVWCASFCMVICECLCAYVCRAVANHTCGSHHTETYTRSMQCKGTHHRYTLRHHRYIY